MRRKDWAERMKRKKKKYISWGWLTPVWKYIAHTGSHHEAFERYLKKHPTRVKKWYKKAGIDIWEIDDIDVDDALFVGFIWIAEEVNKKDQDILWVEVYEKFYTPELKRYIRKHMDPQLAGIEWEIRGKKGGIIRTVREDTEPIFDAYNPR